ncbi:MAG: ABC transporter ATP-binding protein [Thermoanaerobaculia bacterium]|nr:ABC transporter ATP-binding protein [Thermoanaerobaculia bacterium]
MITTRSLVKRYGDTVALDGVDLEVPAGVVYGLVGPNGAGKTTLLSILAGLRSPTDGEVEIDAERDEMAVLPDAPRWEPWLTGREVVELSVGLASSGAALDVDAVLAEAGLADAADRRVGGYSRGMLQRLGLAATVVTSPTVLLLDEPASALDPAGRRETLDLVRRLRGQATVVFSSHILTDVQEVSDWIGVLDRGRLLYQGSAEELLGGERSVYEVRVRGGARDVADALGGREWVESATAVDDRLVRVHATSVEAAERDLTAVLAETKVRLMSVAPARPTLEEVFMELTR